MTSWVDPQTRSRVNLRSSVTWEGLSLGTKADALQHRLTELLIFELHKDGSSRYINLSVRRLYRHVLAVITSAKAHDMTSAELDAVKGETNYADPKSPKSSIPPITRKRAVSIGAPPLLKANEEDNNNVTYRERLGGYLHPRDMRRLVTPFSASNEPALLVRRHVMLLNFDPLRAIILRDRLIVLVPDGADSILAKLENRVRGTPEVDSSFLADRDMATSTHSTKGGSGGEVKKRSFGNALSKIMSRQKILEVDHFPSSSGTPASSIAPSDGENLEDHEEHDEWDEMKGSEWIDLPFELQCADACLHTVCELLGDDTHNLQKTTVEYLHRIVNQHGLGDDPLTIIRAVKDAVREMSSRVNSFVQSISRTLDEDEDMVSLHPLINRRH